MTLDKCKSKWEGDYGDIPCNLYDGHGGHHESAWFEFPDGSLVRQQWTNSVRTSQERK
jgi:hypothetical protein